MSSLLDRLRASRMHNLLWAGILIVVCVSASSDAQEPSSGPPRIFREVTFEPSAPITLGKPLPSGAPRTVPLRGGRAALAVQGFGDTDSIYVDTPPKGIVTRLEFVYPSSKNLYTALVSYRQTLGPATHVSSDSASGRLDRWTWSDSATVCEFSAFRPGAGTQRLWSTLRDRTLP
jgi:hypothetical protein